MSAHQRHRGVQRDPQDTGESDDHRHRHPENGAITGSAAISLAVATIPTLGTWSFVLLALGLAAVAVRTLRLGSVRAR